MWSAECSFYGSDQTKEECMLPPQWPFGLCKHNITGENSILSETEKRGRMRGEEGRQDGGGGAGKERQREVNMKFVHLSYHEEKGFIES